MTWNRPATLLLIILFALTVLLMPEPTQAAGTCRTTEITSVRTLDHGYVVRFNRCVTYSVTPVDADTPAPITGAATMETLTWTKRNTQRYMRQIITDAVGNTYQTSTVPIP